MKMPEAMSKRPCFHHFLIVEVGYRVFKRHENIEQKLSGVGGNGKVSKVFLLQVGQVVGNPLYLIIMGCQSVSPWELAILQEVSTWIQDGCLWQERKRTLVLSPNNKAGAVSGFYFPEEWNASKRSMFSIFHSLQLQADDVECALSSHWRGRSQYLPELWTQDESQVQMEVAVERRPRFPQQGLLRNKTGRVGISNTHRCREEGREGGAEAGPEWFPLLKASSQGWLLKGPFVLKSSSWSELVSSRRPHLKLLVSSTRELTRTPQHCPGPEIMGMRPLLRAKQRTKWRTQQWPCFPC